MSNAVSILFSILKIVVGFVLLIKGADFFVDGSAAVASKLGVPQIVIGLTIVAFGTSAPEAAVSLSAALLGNNGISVGNVLGSNTINILLVLGVSSIITTLHVKKDALRVDIPFMILSTVVMVCWGLFVGRFNKLSGAIFLAALIIYLIYLYRYAKTHGSDDEEDVKDIKIWLLPIYIIGGLIAIVGGSDITINGATALAHIFNVSDRVIGLTIIAFGTSLPELITSATAARKGNADIAIGNIVGSNLFNILFIIGLTSMIIDLPYVSKNASFVLDGFVALFAAVLLWLLTFKEGKLGRAGGIVMLLFYAVYFAYLMITTL